MAAILISAIACFGCSQGGQGSFANQRLSLRSENTARTWSQLAAVEAQRMPNLRKLDPWINDSLARDRKNFREDMDRIGAHLREQHLRFQDRGPRYVGWIQHWLAGSPDQIEPTAIRMFY